MLKKQILNHEEIKKSRRPNRDVENQVLEENQISKLNSK